LGGEDERAWGEGLVGVGDEGGIDARKSAFGSRGREKGGWFGDGHG